MSRHVQIFCDCCRREITNKPNEPELFVTMIVGNTYPTHYCFDCAEYCLKAWGKVVQKIREKNANLIHEEE